MDDFYSRRKLFDKFIKTRKLKLFTCPGCGYPTLTERAVYDICVICQWEDDSQDDKEADNVWGGPNGNLSLTENRINIGKILIDHTHKLKTNINLDPDYVLAAIKFYEKKKEQIESRMTGDEKPGHPIWKEWEQVRKDLQVALCHDELQ